MKEPKPKTETENVGSANLAPPAAQAMGSSIDPNSIKTVVLPRHRQDALDEAAKLCGDLRNSIEAIGAFAITGHTDVVRQHYAIYVDRVKNLHTLLAKEIENLPTL